MPEGRDKGNTFYVPVQGLDFGVGDYGFISKIPVYSLTNILEIGIDDNDIRIGSTLGEAYTALARHHVNL